MTLLLLLFCSGIAYVVSKLSDSDYSTSLLGSIPGGLSQVVLLAEETKGIPGCSNCNANHTPDDYCHRDAFACYDSSVWAW